MALVENLEYSKLDHRPIIVYMEGRPKLKLGI